MVKKIIIAIVVLVAGFFIVRKVKAVKDNTCKCNNECECPDEIETLGV